MQSVIKEKTRIWTAKGVIALVSRKETADSSGGGQLRRKRGGPAKAGDGGVGGACELSVPRIRGDGVTYIGNLT